MHNCFCIIRWIQRNHWQCQLTSKKLDWFNATINGFNNFFTSSCKRIILFSKSSWILSKLLLVISASSVDCTSNYPLKKNSLLQSDVSAVFLPRCVFDHLPKMLTCLTIFKNTLSKVRRVKSSWNNICVTEYKHFFSVKLLIIRTDDYFCTFWKVFIAALIVLIEIAGHKFWTVSATSSSISSWCNFPSSPSFSK